MENALRRLLELFQKLATSRLMGLGLGFIGLSGLGFRVNLGRAMILKIVR